MADEPTFDGTLGIRTHRHSTGSQTGSGTYTPHDHNLTLQADTEASYTRHTQSQELTRGSLYYELESLLEILVIRRWICLRPPLPPRPWLYSLVKSTLLKTYGVY